MTKLLDLIFLEYQNMENIKYNKIFIVVYFKCDC